MLVHDVEQRSPEWYALRAGMPTASEFSRIVDSKGKPSKQMEGYARTLAAEMYAGETVDAWEGNAWTERGRELEDEALRFYAFTNEVEPALVGFVTDDDALIGCSPDALIGDDGMAEIKCLKAENHIKVIEYHAKHGRCPTDYVQQTQGQMMIAERQWCDLIFYHPKLPPLVIRQTPDGDVVDGLRVEIPKLLSERERLLTMLGEVANPNKEAA